MNTNKGPHKGVCELDKAFVLTEVKNFRLDDGNTYAVVGHNLHNRVISDVWFGSFKTEANFKTVAMFILSQIETGRYDYWLADVRFITAMIVPSKNFVFKTLLSKAFSCGLKKFAIIFTEASDLKTRRDESTEIAEAMFNDHLSEKIRFFHDNSEARNWLLDDL